MQKWVLCFVGFAFASFLLDLLFYYFSSAETVFHFVARFDIKCFDSDSPGAFSLCTVPARLQLSSAHMRLPLAFRAVPEAWALACVFVFLFLIFISLWAPRGCVIRLHAVAQHCMHSHSAALKCVCPIWLAQSRARYFSSSTGRLMPKRSQRAYAVSVRAFAGIAVVDPFGNG